MADRPADHTAVESVEHNGAVTPALPGRVLGDVGHARLVRAAAMELPVDEILGDGAWDASPLAAATL